MKRVAAGGIVTVMPHDRRQGATVQSTEEVPVGLMPATIDLETPVAVSVDGSGPKPAFAR
jgi:hypothetical protein